MTKKVVKKRAGDSAAQRQKTGVKRRKDGRFATGNTVGEQTRFQAGGRGGPGRPPNLGSPRAQLKRFAEEIAPKKLRQRIQRQIPGIDTDSLTWAEAIALVHLVKAAEGDMTALNAIYKQLEDSGADMVASKLQVTGKDGTPLLPLDAARAIAANFDRRHRILDE